MLKESNWTRNIQTKEEHSNATQQNIKTKQNRQQQQQPNTIFG